MKTAKLKYEKQIENLSNDNAAVRATLDVSIAERAVAQAALAAHKVEAASALQLAVATREIELRAEMKLEFKAGADFAQGLLGKA